MMKKKKNSDSYDRREFLKIVASAAFCAPILLTSTNSQTAASTATQADVHLNERPTMSYRKLGRTGFYSSRLVFGCGAALMGGGAPRLLQRAFESGINHFDVGSDKYYKGSERNLAPFLQNHRERVWVVSKAPAVVYAQPDDSVSLEQARSAAAYWTRLMDASLKKRKKQKLNMGN